MTPEEQLEHDMDVIRRIILSQMCERGQCAQTKHVWSGLFADILLKKNDS